ncbi:MAG: aspartate/glutamate racemase family protein [bacterium]|nr:aspartate/glutamate racemase family protein [bacterium]
MALIGMIHSTRFVIDAVHNAVTSACRDIDILHVMDEGLLRALKPEDGITPEITEWMTDMVRSVEKQGAELAVVSCSSLSPCVSEIRKSVKIPVVKIDEPMVEWAVNNASTIGLVMTNPTTESPSKSLIEEVAQRAGKDVTVVSRLCLEAFWKLNAGDINGHDDEVIRAIHELLQDVEVVILAQISIARVTEKLDDDIKAKVLSSLNFIGPEIYKILQS